MLLDVKTLYVREFMLVNLVTFPKDLVNIGMPAVNPVYATARHIHQGLRLDIDSAVVPYRSTSVLRRRIIEACLISLCSTIEDTKASSSTRDMDIIGPIILGASPIDWKLMVASHPTHPPQVVPKACKRFFPIVSPDNQADTIHPPDTSTTSPSDTMTTPRYNTRSGMS